MRERARALRIREIRQEAILQEQGQAERGSQQQQDINTEPLFTYRGQGRHARGAAKIG